MGRLLPWINMTEHHAHRRGRAPLSFSIALLFLLPAALGFLGTASAAQVILYQENFDSGTASGWLNTGLWHVSSCRSWSPAFSLAYNDPLDPCPPEFSVGTTAGDAISPMVSIPLTATSATLMWHTYFDTESLPFDRKETFVSDNGGSTWTSVHLETGGASGGWLSRTADLSAYVGKTVQIRFAFDSGDSINNDGEGWYVDSVLVVADVPQCLDGQDNDGDGSRDWPVDTGCAAPNDDSEAPTPQCFDGMDNDGDGRIDWPIDPDCTSPYDNQEAGPQCSDGQDNDGDGRLDYPLDTGCTSPTDTTEAPNPQCSDGIDNDGDGWTDFGDDPGCDGLYDNSELPIVPQCRDRKDNDGDGRVDYPADTGCTSTEDSTEAPTPQCSDGVNNDGDFFIDWPLDPQCSSLYDNSEAF